MQKIKKDLIHKAKVKKEYAKLKAREESEGTVPRKTVYEREDQLEDQKSRSTESVPEPTLEPHPDRLKMLEEAEPDESKQRTERRQQRPRPMPYEKEAGLAQKKREEAEARQAAREEAAEIRGQKLAERDRFRKTMAKARGGPNGQRKLGRESTVLLAKAERLMGRT